MPKLKNTKNPNYRKLTEKIEKIGGATKATNAQLERLFNLQHIKYVMSIEDQLKEDKAHLLLKQNTIETLEGEIKLKNRKLSQIELFQRRLAKKLNTRATQDEDDYKKLGERLVEFRDANNDLYKKNQDLVKDNFELTRAYNGLHTLGKFAEESGVDIKKHNGKLPENSKWEFEQKHTLTEGGKVKHQYRVKPKKENKTNE